MASRKLLESSVFSTTPSGMALECEIFTPAFCSFIRSWFQFRSDFIIIGGIFIFFVIGARVVSISSWEPSVSFVLVVVFFVSSGSKFARAAKLFEVVVVEGDSGGGEEAFLFL